MNSVPPSTTRAKKKATSPLWVTIVTGVLGILLGSGVASAGTDGISKEKDSLQQEVLTLKSDFAEQ